MCILVRVYTRHVYILLLKVLNFGTVDTLGTAAVVGDSPV